MAVPKGTTRWQHNITKEVRYFRNPPNKDAWTKVGTPGSKNWRWINNNNEERFVHMDTPIPEGFILGRVKL